MKKGMTVSTKVTIIVLLIVLVNSISIGAFSYVMHRNDTIKSNQDRVMAIAKSSAMSIAPDEFRNILASNEKDERYELLRKQFETIFEEEKLHYFYGGTFNPEAGGDETAMIMYIEGHGDMFGLNGSVRATIFRQEARDAYLSGAARVTEVYALNVDGVPGIAAYAPILGENGEPIGLVGVIISLQEAISKSNSFALIMLVISLVIFCVIAWIPIVYIRRNVAKPLLALQTASNKIAEGDMDIHIPKRKGNDEIGILSENFSTMKETVTGIHQEILNLVENATVGKLGYRANADKYSGEWREVIAEFNDLMDTIMLPIDEAADALHEIAGGNFNTRILGEYRGDFDRIKKAVNSTAIDLDRYLAEKEKAENELFRAEQETNRAKSDFLSRMSHEMRTPMNAIIGMTKIAESTDDISRIKYCIETISTSSGHLLGIINDVLDMSKIEAGKFELENVPMNIEKMLMKVCNIIADNMEKKRLKFNVFLGKNLGLNYIADDLRLTQVLTNLLSNAIKFTPEGGTITLGVQESERYELTNKLCFSIADTGIGMTSEQISRLFNAFEQADGSVSRKYGGTGLGLVISKSIIEKMGGRIWVESELGVGSKFSFEVVFERASHQDTVIFDGIRPEDLRLLLVESDDDVRQQFVNITDSFGIKTDATWGRAETIELLDAAKNTGRAYDIIFLDCDISGFCSVEFANELGSRIDKETVIIVTTYLEWHRLEKLAFSNRITRFITKPLFPSSILDAINDVVGTALKNLDIKADRSRDISDLSGVRILLAEDVDINREIFITLLEETKITIDIAENGLDAVAKFVEDPDKYDLIVMDIQMPEMDGYQATRTIREMDLPQAKTIPIVAMTANAFKEDIERCLESGMNDHLAKPIDEKAVIEKIVRYTGR
ncbi:MAG: response regulator [Oscillospiraceae bacterium]|nr:response regulator [Oscillospiraceae bacterium]